MAEIATPLFGYKSHIGIDQRHGFIRTWSASDAARYDGRELPGLSGPEITVIWLIAPSLVSVQTPALVPVPCQNISRSPQGGTHRSDTTN